jgi:hypothetical protein
VLNAELTIRYREVQDASVYLSSACKESRSSNNYFNINRKTAENNRHLLRLTTQHLKALNKPTLRLFVIKAVNYSHL